MARFALNPFSLARFAEPVSQQGNVWISDREIGYRQNREAFEI